MTPARPRTILEQAQGALGIWKGTATVAFMICWFSTVRELDREPTVEEYAETWGVSRRTAFREQERFRQAFPGEQTPTRIMSAIAARQADAVTTPRALSGQALPA